MKTKGLLIACLLFAVFFLTACGPEHRVVAMGDGTYAIQEKPPRYGSFIREYRFVRDRDFVKVLAMGGYPVDISNSPILRFDTREEACIALEEHALQKHKAKMRHTIVSKNVKCNSFVDR